MGEKIGVKRAARDGGSQAPTSQDRAPAGAPKCQMERQQLREEPTLDIDLIDILWRQDVDLGARREVFDYSHRQKEYELEKKKKLEKERQEQLQKEKEKSLLARLQLDEETGEFVPIQPAQQFEPEPSPVPTEPAQNTSISEQESEALSFDECMQLLADTFPFVDDIKVENSPVFVAPRQTDSSILHPTMPDPNSMQDVEQVWQELLSIPELQCLNIQSENMADQTTTTSTAGTDNDNCSFFTSLVLMDKPVLGCSPQVPNTFENSYHTLVQPENLNQIGVSLLNTNVSQSCDSFCNIFYSSLLSPENENNIPPVNNANHSLTGPLDESPLKSIDIVDLSVCKGFEADCSTDMSEFPDSDSAMSIDASPNATSPVNSAKSSMYGDAPFGYSDSEMEDMDSNPGSVQKNYSICPTEFQGDAQYQTAPSLVPQKQTFNLQATRSPRKEVPASPGHNKAPFTKDKISSRIEARLTRDEQRAKALNIPFSVEKIINLPVDDFNEMMSKHQFNEAQLALIRDIRRRGKNKVAAQNCRKRKLESIVGLEHELNQLKDDKEKLLKEKREYDKNLRLIKQQLNSLYHDVFSMLCDEDGKPYSPSEYSLQQTSDGSVFLVPRVKKPEIRRE
ncbi:nuclear factor erythroid 2-related factor 2a isoform X2 [Latimeria chalumnae]|uniref:nuclear factor erythroid 2-related factor 2a isoform X2 n=1 Tax=Latimeria chalumnae TaxID=7897 RepID=UPI00313B8CC4